MGNPITMFERGIHPHHNTVSVAYYRLRAIYFKFKSMRTFAEQRRELYSQLAFIYAELSRIDNEERQLDDDFFDTVLAETDTLIDNSFKAMDRVEDIVACKPKRKYPKTLPIRSIRASIHTNEPINPKESRTFDVRCYQDV